MTKLTDIIKQQAQFAADSGVKVILHNSYNAVEIKVDESEGVLLQGDEANQFNDDLEALILLNVDIEFDTLRLYLAYPYLDLFV